EGAVTNHFVEFNKGNQYDWGVYKEFSPDVEANPTDYKFTTTPNSDKVGVIWKLPGLYYLKVTETDIESCTNAKAIAISVLKNSRTIGFENITASACYNTYDNSFVQPIETLNNFGNPLDSIYFPILVEFTVNSENYSQVVEYNNQFLNIYGDWFIAKPEQNSIVSIKLTKVIDRYKATIQPHPVSNICTYTILAHPALEFITAVSDVTQGASILHSVKMIQGKAINAYYTWEVSPETGTSTNLGKISDDSATIAWDGPLGFYALKVSVLDGNGCLSDTIIQQIEIIEAGDFTVDAGRDTTIGSCSPYMLQATVDEQSGMTYSYLWLPAENLDDPTIATPVFTPGNTTVFKLTVTNNYGASVIDSVKITVPEIVAQAGDDILMYEGETAILNGTESIGETLQYYWTTNAGTIDSGENTANPVISGFGMYYLEITDTFACVATDSIKVGQLTYAPIAVDDYDTTAYKTEVKISVLDNDSDPEHDIDSLSLKITLLPFNGTVYVDYNDFTIHYTPNNGFSGNDNFEYQICNFSKNCENADIFVLVTEYEFIVPDAFSPNGDGINDYFEIIGIEKYEGNSISIFNRWGNEVYKATNYGISTSPQFWDGKSNTGFMFGNEELPTGTYYYVLNLGNGASPIGGSVYLDR
ncbi:MAG: T9SS type B sorting domain-containing protein, partial [Draconibacterium sp.]|nr:T9SS type B sorting domain-containing protein [Draconibacterium sp.]